MELFYVPIPLLPSMTLLFPPTPIHHQWNVFTSIWVFHAYKNTLWILVLPSRILLYSIISMIAIHFYKFQESNKEKRFNNNDIIHVPLSYYRLYLIYFLLLLTPIRFIFNIILLYCVYITNFLHSYGLHTDTFSLSFSLGYLVTQTNDTRMRYTA